MTYLLTAAVFFIVMIAMAIGWILKKKTIAGSCGGFAGVGIEKECDCDKPCDEHKLYQIQEPGQK
ncbi:(Na+)-NQR maturation NqrM [Photobacterium damselae subsp. damselae]|uniref:(Na+)-NQR maturation NqrM n=1 Tax=Photobacterium damselae TaxID=38293 RepID=UPI0010FD1951|nr:(Na+)-NQR maturation NqrM [Photobacterium damselae]TLS88718.1 (Na+)-NQR maturation NqrM [Photobacterium damselae subsp. damselae]